MAPLTTLTTLTLSLTTTLTHASPPQHPPSGRATAPKLWEPVPSPGEGIYIWISSIAPTFYGQDSEDFDFQLINTYGSPDSEKAIDAAETLARIYPSADQDGVELMVAFLNATGSGMMSASEAADRHWLCNELNVGQARLTKACEGVKLEHVERTEL